MTRLRKKHLPHLVNLTPVAGEGAEGATAGTPVTGVAAYVEEKTRLVIDRRSTSPTAGKEIVSSALVVLLPENDVPPGTQVTIWPGTARERTAAAVTSAKFDYKRTPNHIELRLD